MTDTLHAAEETESPQVTGVDLQALNDTIDYLRPALQADGGDVILLGVEGGTVHLELVGACGGCPMATLTLTAGIERILRDRVPGITDVDATSATPFFEA
jgi:Fe-S cluster biogenesis protein NfuA